MYKRLSIVRRLALTFLLTGTCGVGLAQQTQNLHERVTSLLNQMTVEEKVDLLRATSPGVERLGVPKYLMGNEALHGVVRPGKFTVFPQAIGLASMWNPELHYQIATAISDEARAKWNAFDQGREQKEQFSDLLVFWSPTVNMARDPRWGRTPETYGEDPYLSGVLGAAFVRGLQGNDPNYLKVVATPKHFSANNEEHNRFECNADISERDMREYYLPAFERCIRQGKAESIMSAYNSINHVPCTVNPWLLKHVLREEWGFQGFVVSDCGAPALVMTDHHFVRLPETAAALCLKSGLDLECGDNIFKEPLLSAYRQHMVTEAEIDSAAYHVLRSKIRLGVMDDPAQVPYAQLSPSLVGCDKHHQMALEAARQSMVLLKNERNTLPLNAKKIKKIAVVGINAANCELGDYSGVPVHEPISVLEGIRRQVGSGVEVYTAPWRTLDNTQMQLLGGDALPSGFKAEYYSNRHLVDAPKVRTDKNINYEPKNQAPDPFLPQAPMSVRWTGELVAPVTGNYTFNFQTDDGCRLWIDGKLLMDDWTTHPKRDCLATVHLQAGQHYQLQAEYYDDGGECIARLLWSIPGQDDDYNLDLYQAGMEQNIRQSDVVVAVMGINQSIEREGQDRNSLSLPADQQQFIRRLYAINPRTVLVLVAGSSLAIDWEQEHLPAILDAWYGGEQSGVAVAETLFGQNNPAGRLPLTFYRSMDDLPPFNDYDISKGRTYQYFQGEPLYPFGYGLSYTTFRYKNLTTAVEGDEVKAELQVQNTGKCDGDEVVQLYVQYPEMERPTPIRQLQAFERISLKKGETKTVRLTLPKEQLRLWDDDSKAFYTPKGTYTFIAGKHSADTSCQVKVEIP